jgi:hypothetical protein
MSAMRTESHPELAELIVQASQLHDAVQAAEVRDRFRLIEAVGHLSPKSPQQDSCESTDAP